MIGQQPTRDALGDMPQKSSFVLFLLKEKMIKCWEELRHFEELD
jgi:hypothetical protein